MGCAASKLDNQDTVRRCKDRRRHIKQAVHARHHLATAHSDYIRSLCVTGSALAAFASGEPLAVSHHAPAVLLRTPSISSAAAKPPAFVPPPPHHRTPSPSLPRPPPPPPMSTASSHHPPPPPIRRKKTIKLPHILSDSSFTSSPPPNHRDFTYNARAYSTYSTTPSQTSTVWNWDNFLPPPSPPSSEHFRQLINKNTPKPQINSDTDNDEKASNFTSYSNTHQFHNPFISDHGRNYRASNYSDPPIKKGPNMKKWESEEDETEREEVQCSDWGDHDHYSSTSNSSDETENLKSRSDFRPMKNEANAASVNIVNANVNSNISSISEDDIKSSVIWRNKNSQRTNSDCRIVVRHKDLGEIVAAIKEYFDKAALAGEPVTEMLETGRAQIDRGLKRTVYHSSGMLSNLSSRWTSKPPLSVKYKFEPSLIEESGNPKSLCSTLERLLAWEKKLYEEMKAREGVKIEHEKKLSSLQSQEHKGVDGARLDKTKTKIKKLQSLIVVTSQAVSTTSSEIIGLRDSDLVPQLVELCHGFMYMWRSMNQFHEAQNDIIQQVRGLVIEINKGQSTSDLHRQSTCDLESAVSAWHTSFCRLARYMGEFVRFLHSWFKLTLIPIHQEPLPNKNERLSSAFSFCDEWKLALDRVPDTVASESIKSFVSVVHSISLKQTEEIKAKKRTEVVSKELEKKASSLRSIEKKYYRSYSMVGIGPPESSGLGLDVRDPLAEKKAELGSCRRRVEDEMQRHARAVEVTRAMTLNNIQTGLPGVFQAMTSFSALMNEALETVCNRSYAI